MTEEEAILRSIADEIPCFEFLRFSQLVSPMNLRLREAYICNGYHPCRIYINNNALIIKSNNNREALNLFTCEDIIKEIIDFIEKEKTSTLSAV